MKLKVLERFIDKCHGHVTREIGDIYEEEDADRASLLIRGGFVEEVKSELPKPTAKEPREEPDE